MKKCDKPGCDIVYNEMYQTPVKKKRGDEEIIRDYMYRIIMKEKIKNEKKTND